MDIELAPKCGARSVKVSSGSGLSILATLISPLFAVLLSEYLSTQEKHQVTFAPPIQDADADRRQSEYPETRPEPSTVQDSPRDHARCWQAFPIREGQQDQAKKLIRKADDTKGDPASQFIMLRLAKDMATQASDGQTAFQAIDIMAETFRADANAMKMAVLTRFASTAQRPAQHRSIAEQALQVANQAVRQEHFMVANQLGKLALAEANKAVDRELLAQVQCQIAEVAERVKSRSSR